MTSKKGVSTLVASVLLIAFTVSVAMIVMGWFSSFARSTTENVSGVTQGAIGCSSGIIEVDHIYVSGTSAINATINVINSGQIPLTVNAMLVNSSGAACRTTTGVTVQSGSTGSISLNTSSCNINAAGNFSRALLTTSCAGITASTTSSSDITVQ